MDSNETQIRALIEESIDGPNPESAHRRLFEMFESRVESRVREILRDRYDDLGEDAVIGAFTKAFAKLDSFRGEGAFANWLMRISRNYCYDLLRKQGLTSRQIVRSLYRPETESECFRAERPEDVSDAAPCPYEATARREQVDNIRAALERLNDNEYGVAVLVMKGYCNQEIADRLKKSVPAVERLKLRTLEKLETRLRQLERRHE